MYCFTEFSVATTKNLQHVYEAHSSGNQETRHPHWFGSYMGLLSPSHTANLFTAEAYAGGINHTAK